MQKSNPKIPLLRNNCIVQIYYIKQVYPENQTVTIILIAFDKWMSSFYNEQGNVGCERVKVG